MKILVAIANYGDRNLNYLSKLIDEYRSMSYDIDIVILSNIPKDFGPDVEVIVGLPSKNPWSLPFSHKRIFAERKKDYDLFIYSEDDTLVKQRNIEAFLKVTGVLPKDEIAGFLRYEEDADGKRYCCSIHSYFHWVPGSVKSIGKYIFARFTNEHSACYILTQEQLQKAIKSGGYLVGQHEGRYDLLCTAATDPYTQCGFTKVICISHIHDFLLHHLPNQYLGRMGLKLDKMQKQINALLTIKNHKETEVQLCPTETNLSTCKWNKLYYERCRDDIVKMVPNNLKNVLSVGCGNGTTEANIAKRSIKVVAIPLDLIIAASANSKGIEVLPTANFEKAKEYLRNQKFNCILLNNILQHLPYPAEILTECVELLDEEGSIIITVPNFNYIKYFYQTLVDGGVYKDRKNFQKTHLHLTTSRMVTRWISKSGLKIIDVKYHISNQLRKLTSASLGLLSRYLAPEILFIAKKV